jgi:peptidoglycan-associated lipoprotein
MMKVVSSLLLTLLVAACASTEPAKPVPVESKVPTATMAPPATPTTLPTSQPAIEVNPLKDPNNILSRRSVFFDYDSNVVKDEFRAMIQAHAKYLVEHRGASVRLEGNTDERGSREYNLALGQRRADAVKKIMVVLGVPETNVETISFGEEKPRASGHDEPAWSQNRRSDIIHQGE